MKTPSDRELHLFALAVTITAVEERARVHLRRVLWLSALACGFRIAAVEPLLIASLALASREIVPGCIDILRARQLRRAFGKVDCG